MRKILTEIDDKADKAEKTEKAGKKEKALDNPTVHLILIDLRKCFCLF